jgi:hypothetical protein
MQDEFSDPPRGDEGKSSSPLQSLRKKRNDWLSTTALTAVLNAAAYDDPELIAQCSPGERNSALVRGALLVFYTAFLAMSFAAIGHYLLQSSFSPAIILGAIFLAAFLGLVDHYVMLRTAIFPDGMKGLRHGGFGVDVPIGAGFSSKFCKTLRIMLSLATGGIVALFLGLILNASAVDRGITTQHLTENKVLVQRAVKDFEDRRLRASKAYDSALATANTLRDENSRLTKQSIRKSSSRVADRLAANETRLAPAQASLDDSKRELDAIDASRAEEIEHTIEKSPIYIPKDDSLLARVRALIGAIHEDPWVAAPIAVFDAVIVGIDIVILTLKAIAMPSTYCMQDTRRHLNEMVRQARLTQAETEIVEPSPRPAPPDDGPAPANDQTGANSATPPRRGRGRPPKNRPNGPINGGEHA